MRKISTVFLLLQLPGGEKFAKQKKKKMATITIPQTTTQYDFRSDTVTVPSPEMLQVILISINDHLNYSRPWFKLW